MLKGVRDYSVTFYPSTYINATRATSYCKSSDFLLHSYLWPWQCITTQNALLKLPFLVEILGNFAKNCTKVWVILAANHQLYRFSHAKVKSTPTQKLIGNEAGNLLPWYISCAKRWRNCMLRCEIKRHSRRRSLSNRLSRLHPKVSSPPTLIAAHRYIFETPPLFQFIAT